MRQGKIRILHPLSFIDDPTRILRAVRFEQRYGFAIENVTLCLLRKVVSKKMLERVQPQRVRDELVLLLKEKNSLCALRRLAVLAGVRFIDKKLRATQNMFLLCASIERQIQWVDNVHLLRRPLDIWVVRFMGVVDSLSLAQVKALCTRYMFLKGEQKRLLDYKVLNGTVARRLSKNNVLPSTVYAALRPHSYEAILAFKAKYPHPSLQRRVREFLMHYNDTRIHIGGDELLRLGLVPGPRYQEIFQKVFDARINGALHTKAQELHFARQLIR